MAGKHPYVASSGPLLQVLGHLRKSFPANITASTLKKMGYASNNESYVINVLRFIGIIDEKGDKTSTAGTVFSEHEDKKFQESFADLIKTSYSDLFSLHGDGAWTLEMSKLISYFRNTDQTTELVGKRQASTFQTLASQSGQIALQNTQKAVSSVQRQTPARKPKPPIKSEMTAEKQLDNPTPNKKLREVGLTVRVEINLPADGNQETYDRIFRSIRENLIDGDQTI